MVDLAVVCAGCCCFGCPGPRQIPFAHARAGQARGPCHAAGRIGQRRPRGRGLVPHGDSDPESFHSGDVGVKCRCAVAGAGCYAGAGSGLAAAVGGCCLSIARGIVYKNGFAYGPCS